MIVVGQMRHTPPGGLRIALNAMAVSLRWDPSPFVLPNLVFSTQAAYAAPLILLAQTRRAVTPREREVLRLRFEEEHTQREIGQRIGVSQMQTSRIIRHSIARLRTAAGA